MTLRPINGHVVIRRAEAEQLTPGGIHLPDTAREGQKEGEVIAVAEDATEEVATGDRVIYSGFSGTEISIDGEEYVVLSSDDLMAKYVAVDKIPE